MTTLVKGVAHVFTFYTLYILDPPKKKELQRTNLNLSIYAFCSMVALGVFIDINDYHSCFYN